MISQQIYKISKKNKQVTGKGTYGKYFRISKKKGIKVLGRGYKEEGSVYRCRYFFDAISEVENLVNAEKSGISPKHAKVIIVKYNKKYYAGILMEHIDGHTFYSRYNKMILNGCPVDKKSGKVLNYKNKNTKTVIQYIQEKLSKQKIFHRDIHEGNVMITKTGKLKVIDFSPDWITRKR